jgi:hypothetical protein
MPILVLKFDTQDQNIKLLKKSYSKEIEVNL